MSALPLRYLPIGQFLGDQESAEPITLPVALSSGGGKNLTIDKLARATSILGYSKRNAAAITSNTGGVALRLRALYHYIYRDPVTFAITRQELGFFDDGANVHFELRKSINAGVTWIFVADLGTGFKDVIPDFAQQGNALSIAFGAGDVRQWDGTTLSVIANTRLAAPTIADAGAGQINGAPAWRVVPLKSDGTRKVASPVSAITPLANRKATVTWVADTDVTVIGYEVYRTTGSGGVASGAGITGISFLVGVTSARLTVTLTDNFADLDLIAQRALQEHGDAPPTASKYAEVSRQRTWYLNIPAYPRRGYWSDPGLPYSVNTAASFFDFTDAESFSDECLGATGNFQNYAQIVWLERSVWTVSGTGEFNGAIIDFSKRRSSAHTGTVHHKTVARIPAGAKFTDATGGSQTTDAVTLAYLTPLKDIRLFDGQNDVVISAPKTATLARLSYAARRKAFHLHDSKRFEVTWVYPADTATEPSYAVTWNYRYGVWYDRPGWASLACAIEVEATDEALILLAGEASTATGGFCYKLWDGYTLGGSTAVGARVETGTLYGSVNMYDRGLTDVVLMSWQKRWRWAEFLVKTSGGPLSLLVEWLSTEAGNEDTAYGSTTVTLGESVLETVDLSLIESVDGSILEATVSPNMIRFNLRCATKKARYLHSRGIRLRFSSTTTTVQWSIVGGNLAYQLLKSGTVRDFRR